jgi:DNA-binding NarL/FixJ family response regulator
MNDRIYRVLLVDDHTLFRTGLRNLLAMDPTFEVTGEAADGLEAIHLLESVSPDAILLDIAMPRMNGMKAAEEIMRRWPESRIVTLSMFGEEEYYFKMVSLGVKAFLLKNSDIGEVREAIRTVVDGGTFFSQELLFNLVGSLRSSSKSAESEDTADLSEREREILLEICKGLSNQEIGEKLFISKRTVDKHRANILAKTNCKNTANLVVYAIKSKLVEI